MKQDGLSILMHVAKDISQVKGLDFKVECQQCVALLMASGADINAQDKVFNVISVHVVVTHAV